MKVTDATHFARASHLDPDHLMINVNNGREQIPWVEGMTVRDLLRACNYTFPNLLVTVNGTVVHADAYEATPLRDGDDVWVLHLFGGG